MKTTRWLVGALLVGGLSAVAGCGGSGTYQIPNVAPVVKQKPADQDLLEELGGDGAGGSESSEAPKSGDDEPKK
jgi:hypothetical protein